MNDPEGIRALNDTARCNLQCYRVMITIGVQQLRSLPEVFEAVRSFDRFTDDNDPYGEHDFGSVVVGGETLFWKFDYYDLSLQTDSPDAADPSVTVRVLTVMLAEEY